VIDGEHVPDLLHARERVLERHPGLQPTDDAKRVIACRRAREVLR
jgi:hypothetical protein